jgi:hypothetical protein
LLQGRQEIGSETAGLQPRENARPQPQNIHRLYRPRSKCKRSWTTPVDRPITPPCRHLVITTHMRTFIWTIFVPGSSERKCYRDECQNPAVSSGYCFWQVLQQSFLCSISSGFWAVMNGNVDVVTAKMCVLILYITTVVTTPSIYPVRL